MDRIKKAALIITLADRLLENGSWCGETHIQKAGYFLQELLGVPMGFSFVLYRHGPFSFDLRDELTSLRADGLMTLELRNLCGPHFVTTELGQRIQRTFPKTVDRYRNAIEFVASTLGDKNVAELERLATALFVTLAPNGGGMSADQRAGRLNEIKGHIPLELARDAVGDVDRIIAEARLPAHSTHVE